MSYPLCSLWFYTYTCPQLENTVFFYRTYYSTVQTNLINLFFFPRSTFIKVVLMEPSLSIQCSINLFLKLSFSTLSNHYIFPGYLWEKTLIYIFMSPIFYIHNGILNGLFWLKMNTMGIWDIFLISIWRNSIWYIFKKWMVKLLEFLQCHFFKGNYFSFTDL